MFLQFNVDNNNLVLMKRRKKEKLALYKKIICVYYMNKFYANIKTLNVRVFKLKYKTDHW